MSTNRLKKYMVKGYFNRYYPLTNTFGEREHIDGVVWASSKMKAKQEWRNKYFPVGIYIKDDIRFFIERV